MGFLSRQEPTQVPGGQLDGSIREGRDEDARSQVAEEPSGATRVVATTGLPDGNYANRLAAEVNQPCLCFMCLCFMCLCGSVSVPWRLNVFDVQYVFQQKVGKEQLEEKENQELRSFERKNKPK